MGARASSIQRRAFLGAMASLPFGGAALAETQGKLAQGTPFETPYFWNDSGEPGPTVMIVAGIHGNEGAPPLAAGEFIRTPLVRGRLFLIPEANRPALAARSRYMPRSRHPDLNRNFPTELTMKPRGELAQALWATTSAVAPNWVLDLHEGWGFSASSKSMGSSVVLAPDPRVDKVARPMAERVLKAINATVTTAAQRFTLIEPGPAGSYARAVVELRATPALVLETTWTQAVPLRVSQQLVMVRSVLEALDMIDAPPP